MGSPDADPPLSPMICRNKKLLESAEFSDFTIKVGHRSFQVHRSIICPQSDFLYALCTSRFKEGQERVGSLEEQDPDIFERVLLYLYTNRYDLTSTMASSDPPPSVLDTLNQSSSGDQDTDAREVVPCGGGAVSTGDGDLQSHASSRTSTTIDKDTAVLLTHVRTHNLAEFLQIPDLRSMTLASCENCLSAHFPPQEHQAVLAEAFIGSSSQGLKTLVMKMCLQNRDKLSEDIISLFNRHEPLAWSMAQVAHTDANKQRDGSSAIAATLHDQLEQQKELTRVQKTQANDARKNFRSSQLNIANVIECVNGRQRCRNTSCNQDFGVRLEAHYGPSITTITNVRCDKCQCRHQL